MINYPLGLSPKQVREESEAIDRASKRILADPELRREFLKKLGFIDDAVILSQKDVVFLEEQLESPPILNEAFRKAAKVHKEMIDHEMEIASRQFYDDWKTTKLVIPDTKNKIKYCLVQDDDGHYFLIPSDKREEWEDWLDQFYQHEFPETGRPDWAEEIDGPHKLDFYLE